VFGGNGIRGYTPSYTHDGSHVLIGRQGALCGNVNFASGRFWASEHAVVATPVDGINVRWLGALLQSMNLNQHSQSAAQPGISVDLVARLDVPVPPLITQRAIADYLDRDTARIDALVAAKERMVALLEEARGAFATDALLGSPVPGGPAGRGQVTLRPGWSLIPFRRLFREIDVRSETGSETLLSVSQTRGVIPQSDLGERRQYAETLVGYKTCLPGDLVVNRMWVYYGALGAASTPGIVSPDYAVFTPMARLSAKFAAYVLRTPAYVGEMTRLVRGIGAAFQDAVRKPRLHPSEMGLIEMPVPPPDEEKALLRRLETQTDAMMRRIALLNQSTELLQERRQALITAAVSGQLDILEAA